MASIVTERRSVQEVPSRTYIAATVAPPIFFWSEKPFLDGDNSIDEIIEHLDILEDRVTRALTRALEPVAENMGQHAQLTDAYENVTHATRESTVGYVLPPGGTSDDSPQAVLAQARAESLNPGHVDYGLVEADDDEIAVIVQSMTDYSLHLNLRGGSESAYLLDSMASGVGLAEQTVQDTIKRYFKE